MLLDLHFKVHHISDMFILWMCRLLIAHMVILLMMNINSMVRYYYVSLCIVSPDFWILFIVLGYRHVILDGFTLVRLIFIHILSGAPLSDYFWIPSKVYLRLHISFYTKAYPIFLWIETSPSWCSSSEVDCFY